MNAKKFTKALLAGLATGSVAFGLAAPAAADYDTTGYGNALDAAGLIDHDGHPCNGPYDRGVGEECRYQFDDVVGSVWTGTWICRQVEQGRSRDSIQYDISHGDGLSVSTLDAPTVYDAVTTYLC
jgi:hypothetical protein